MKKLVSFAALAALVATAADAAPRQLTRNQDGSYNVTYDYTDRAEAGWWYMGGRLDLNLLSWENEYSSTDPDINVAFNSDDYSFEPVFGGNIFVGHTFEYFWRAEVEAGLISQFDDSDDGFDFKLTVPYLMANGYYDFANGLYVGAGLGIAMPKTQLGGYFKSDDRSERNVSLMGALMAGWSYHLDYNLLLDIRYRLAVFGGTEHERTLNNGYKFKNDIGMIWDNSISVGLRYEF